MAKIPVVFPSTPEEQAKAQRLYDEGLAGWGGDTPAEEELSEKTDFGEILKNNPLTN
jgi:hypothetical protein